ncbi:transposase [Dactylosporangium sp. NPDC051485]|uniref:transposase n=1 Tax=Dactylosporangium sp. NPDC051485 TaxID=3154846 RepID=UPI0034178B76
MAVDGYITKAVAGGEHVGPSPAGRGNGGRKRSVATDGRRIPLGIVAAGANWYDAPLLGPALDAVDAQLGGRRPGRVTVHLDAGYDSAPTRDLLTGRGCRGRIARRGKPAPVQTGWRWVVEANQAWMNDFGKLRRRTDRRASTPLASGEAIVTASGWQFGGLALCTADACVFTAMLRRWRVGMVFGLSQAAELAVGRMWQMQEPAAIRCR